MLRTATIAAFAVVLTGCDFENFSDSSRFKEDFHYSFPLKSGGRLYLENLNGAVEITAWDQETCDISGTKHAATREQLDALKIDIVPASDSIRVRTVRPSDSRGGMGARYVVRVPRQTGLERIATSNGGLRVTGVQGACRLRTSNGPVRVADLRGELEVRTSNGPVEIDRLEGPATVETSNGPVRANPVRGAFSAVTSNGPIQVRLEEPEAHHAVRLESSNASIDLTMAGFNDNGIHASSSNAGITVRLPASAGARVKAVTSHGSVASDFELSGEGARSRTRLEGMIGSGGPLVDLSTSNGGIRILKGGD